MHYKLVLQNHVEGLATSSWNITPPVVVGRDPSSQVCIDHDSISRKHCQFSINIEGAVAVKDLGSMNGTYVDDQRIQQTTLMPGQVVQIGALMLQIEFLEEAPKPASTKPQTSGSVYATQPMETFKPVPIPPEKSWWQKIFG